ncbi:MAG: hypothetical protein AAF985_26585 [Bacteroidota bacterium]
MTKKMITSFLPFLFLMMLACNGEKQATQKEKLNLADYEGKFKVIEEVSFKYLDFFEKEDTLFVDPSDDEVAGLFYERNDVFGCPRYNVKVKFFRNDQGIVDSLGIFAGMEKFHALKQ